MSKESRTMDLCNQIKAYLIFKGVFHSSKMCDENLPATKKFVPAVLCFIFLPSSFTCKANSVCIKVHIVEETKGRALRLSVAILFLNTACCS